MAEIPCSIVDCSFCENVFVLMLFIVYSQFHTYSDKVGLGLGLVTECITLANGCPCAVIGDHITPLLYQLLAESSVADRLQAGLSGLQMSSWPGIVIPRWRTSSTSRVLKASAFRFVSRTVCSQYLTLNQQWPSFSSRHCTDVEQSSAAYRHTEGWFTYLNAPSLHVFYSRWKTYFSELCYPYVPAKWHCHLWTR